MVNGQQKSGNVKCNFCPSIPGHRPRAAPRGRPRGFNEQFANDLKIELASLPAHLRGGNQTNSRAHLDPTRTHSNIVLHSNRKYKKTRNSNKDAGILSRKQQQDKGDQPTNCLLCSCSSCQRNPVGQGMPERPSIHPRAHRQPFNCIYWPQIVCLNSNCNIWHLVLRIQRVKLCPIKIKISTFIIL